MKQLLGDQGNLEKLPDVKVMTEKEQEVLRHIRKGNLKELTVRFNKQHEISLIEATEVISKVELESRYMDHVLKNGYQTISFKTEKGKVVNFERVTKQKL